MSGQEKKDNFFTGPQKIKMEDGGEEASLEQHLEDEITQEHGEESHMQITDESRDGNEEEGEIEEVEGATSSSLQFKLLIDKAVAEEIKLFEWCPTMDLLAWVTVDDQLIVQRLSWQRLFGIRTHDRPISALTWRPDGTHTSVLVTTAARAMPVLTAACSPVPQARSLPWATRMARYRLWTLRMERRTTPRRSTPRR